MRPDVVVVASPLLDADLGLHAVSEPLQAQKFVAEFPVERFVGRILPRFAGVNQRRVDLRVGEPAQDGGGGRTPGRCLIEGSGGRRGR